MVTEEHPKRPQVTIRALVPTWILVPTGTHQSRHRQILNLSVGTVVPTMGTTVPIVGTNSPPGGEKLKFSFSAHEKKIVPKRHILTRPIFAEFKKDSTKFT